MKYSNETLKKLYYDLVYGRTYADKMEEAIFAGKVMGSLHLPQGQEAIGVGIVHAMKDCDYLAPTHRLQTASIQKFDVREFTSEILGRASGVNKGICFDYHCSDFDKGMLMPLGTLGSMYPQYTGFAWALKNDGKDSVVIVSQGDSAVNEGEVYEAFNLAAIFKIPIVFVIENNGWGEGTRLETVTVDTTMSNRAIPLGLTTQVVDGNDVVEVMEAMEIAIEKARNFEPNVVELKTHRWKGHFGGDPQVYRDPKEIESLKIHCPVKKMEEKLLEQGIIDEKYITDIKSSIKAELDEIFEEALKQPMVTKEDICRMDWVYADPQTGGEL